ncbi:hypothetical protein OS242_08130 [Tumebacillus sp. DT12]|uniref:Uncharacterized protein n=1 Tax=Tumebacillus lacus TaxID=2995335 RepID=A0ABT3X2V0_9BACL|nr:hypothetical protein [Tumebacillus lacus]MCX7569931.1 hypothetical protein [Tumebacillus lacus]
MFTIGIIALGAIALMSMIMMMGTVLAKSPYGKYWAFLGGASVFLAGVLVVLQAFAPSLEANASTAPEAHKEGAVAVNETPVDEQPPSPADTESTPEALPSGGGTGEDTELAFLGEVMELLKAGQPLPAEFLALLPDGGQGILAAQSKSGTATSQISKPLQSQLVSLDRNNGSARYAGNTYVPNKPSTSTPSISAGKVGTTPSGSTTTPSTTAPTAKPQPTPAPSTGTTPTPPPVNEPPRTTPPPPPPVTTPPAEEQEPPVVTPPPTSVAALLDGGLLKSLLGTTQSDMESYFQYNQYLGKNGSVHRYLLGDKIVEVTLSGDKVSKVVMRFQSFSPQGQSQAYYEDMMRGNVGMTAAVPTSRSGQDIYWNGLYPGASSIMFHIDTAANYGYVQATL